MGVAGAVLLAAALFGSTALAQGVSVVTGKVNDASTHQAVADVVVTATSPNLQGEQIVVTDATGAYRIPQLPPGVYTIRFEKEGFHPYTREGITLRPDITIRVDVDLLPEAITGQEIVVVGKPPTVDVGSTTQGADIGQDFINNLALARPGGVGGSSRGFEALALAVPQSSGDAFGVSINGATAPENSYLVDGVSVNNPAYGLNGSSLTVDFLDDVNVITGGYMPEFGRAMGGTISATTKSGGNEFHGSVFLNLAPGALEADPKVVSSSASVISSSAKTYMVGDFGATLGGYIMKDKLWFFAGIQPSFSRIKGTMNITPAIGIDDSGSPIFADNATSIFSRDAFADQRVLNYIAKLTYLVNPDTRLSLTYNGTYNHSGAGNSYPFGIGADNNDPNAALIIFNGDQSAVSPENTNSANDVTLKMNSSFLNKKLLFDASIGWHHQTVSSLPKDGSTFADFGNGDTTKAVNQSFTRWSFLAHSLSEQPGANLPADVIAACSTQVPDAYTGGTLGACPQSWYSGGPGFMFDSALNSYQLKLVGTYFANALGHHTIKAGFDGDISTYHQIEGYSGGRTLTEYPQYGLFITSRAFADFTGPNQYTLTALDKQTKSIIAGGFIQDSWNILDMVTLNAGVRYDAQSLYNAAGDVALKLGNEWSPRIGLIWDPTQKGKSKVYVNYAKYYEDVPLDLANRALSGESQITQQLFLQGAPGCGPGNLTNNCSSILVPESAALPNSDYYVYGIAPDTVDSTLDPPSSTEIVAGAEYEILESLRASLSYTHRELSGTIEDMSNTNGATFFLGNPGTGASANFPKATRIYNAGTLALTKAFSNNWLLQGSYTVSRLHGNYDGLVSRGYGQLDPNITADFDLAPLLVNGNGPLSIDATHAIKLFAAKEFPVTGNFSVTLGGSYLAHSGYPTNYLGANRHPGYGDNAIYILPRGSGPRLPWLHEIDGHLSLNYRFSKDTQLSATIDAFNLFNRQTFVAIDESYSFYPNGVLPIPNGTVADLANGVKSDGDGHILQPDELNSNFGNAAAFQAPRSVRVGVKLTF